MQVKSLDHIHIYADEPEESARFYTYHFEAKEILRRRNELLDHMICDKSRKRRSRTKETYKNQFCEPEIAI